MKTICLLIASLFFTAMQLSAQTWDWTHPEPNGVVGQNPLPLLGSETDDAHDIETDALGNVYVLGDFADSLYLSNIFREIGIGSYLAKYDSTGNLLWYKTIKVADNTIPNYNKIQATDLTVNAQGVFITGKYIKTTFTSYDCVTGIHNDVVRSYKIGSFSFTSAGNDMGLFITKMNISNGNVVWNKTATEPTCVDGGQPGFGSLSYNPFITSDKNNNVIVSFDFADYRPSMMIGSDVIALNGNYTNGGYYLVAVKYNANGVFQWSNYAGGLNSGSIYDINSIITDNTGAVYFQGTSHDSCFFGNQLFRFSDASTATYLAKISSTGSWQFVKELSNKIQSSAEGNIGNPTFLATDNANNVYALENLRGLSDSANIGGLTIKGGIGLSSTFIVKLDNNGNTKWVKRFGMGNAISNASDYANAIYHSANNLYIAGSLARYGAIPYNFSKLYVPPPCGNVNQNYFVAKADTAADFKWVTTFCGISNNQGFGVAVSGNNIYTCGYYSGSVDGLGNFNGSFANYNSSEHNSFMGKLKDQYIRVGAVTPTSIIPGCTITVPFTSTGLTLSAGNTFTAELSNANGDFTSATAIGTTTSTGTGSITATIPASLTYGSGYRIRIHSSDTLKTGLGYYAYADTLYKLSLVCPAPSSGFAATNITGNTATVNWTAVGCASGYKLQYRVKGTTAWTTAPVITTNTPTLNLTGLTVNTIYQWRVATRCRNNSTTSFSAFSAIKTFTTAAVFASAVAAADLQLQSTGFTVYPNPAKQMATVQFNTDKTGTCTIEVADLTGKMLFSKKLAANIGINKENINLNLFAAGMYMITLIRADHSRQVVKVNKE